MRGLKADQRHLCNYRHTLTDYRHTDKCLGLGVALIADERTDRQTDSQTDERYQYIISYASPSIMKS